MIKSIFFTILTPIIFWDMVKILAVWYLTTFSFKFYSDQSLFSRDLAGLK